MSEKQLVKMAQPVNNGHPRGTNNQTKVARNEQRAQRGKNGARNREKVNGNLVEDDDNGTGRQQKGRNSKKGRLMNDLVNFQYYRPQPASLNHRKTKRYSCDYVKEDYLQVSCQFVVKESDWQALTVVDSSVDWNDVVQVRLPCEELSSCPICLYPPVCTMSPVCGHAMCYSCALRFMENCPGGDCPICHKPLILSEFKPLKTFKRHKFLVGDEIVLKLVSRYRDSRIVCPVDEDMIANNIPNLSCEWGSKFCNVVTASPSQILQVVILAQEEELQVQLALLEDSDRECEPYILQALTELQIKKAECFDQIEAAMKDSQQIMSNDMLCLNGKKVYFYQSEDGQPIFIHPLNSRCLIHEYGSIEVAIPEISCKIVAMEHYTQSPDVRSRYRYFSHLPLGCSFILCEVDITPFISAETYELFKDGIEKRFHARSAKEQKENAYSRKLAEKEVTYHCSEYLPKYTEISQPAKEHYKTSESYDLLVTSPSSPTGTNPLSFAEKLRQGASKSTPWINKSPVLDQRFRINSTSSDISLESESVAAPSFQTSFSASLNDAFATLEVQHVQDTSAPAAQTRGKKKKKGKTISLTGGARRG